MTYLTTEEMNSLAKQAQTGDSKARESLYNNCINYIYSCTKQFKNRGIAFEDLVAEGTCGLFKALDMYDESKGPSFLGYAGYWIRQGMYASVYDNVENVRLPFSQRLLTFKIAKAYKEFKKANNDKLPSTEQLSEMTGIPTWRINMLKTFNKGNVDVDAHLGGDEKNSTYGDLLASSDLQPDEEMFRDETYAKLPTLLKKLPNREHDIIVMLFGIGMEPVEKEKICRMFGFGSERMRQLKERGFKILRQRYSKSLNLLISGIQKD